MCWFNGLYLGFALWHNVTSVSIEDRTRQCSFTHESRTYAGERFELDEFKYKTPIKLRKGLYLFPGISLGVENHKFSERYNDTYIITAPSLKLSSKIKKGIYVDIDLDIGKGFYTVTKNNEIDAPTYGFAPSSSLTLGITVSTDSIFKREKKHKRRRRK